MLCSLMRSDRDAVNHCGTQPIHSVINIDVLCNSRNMKNTKKSLIKQLICEKKGELNIEINLHWQLKMKAVMKHEQQDKLLPDWTHQV